MVNLYVLFLDGITKIKEIFMERDNKLFQVIT